MTGVLPYRSGRGPSWRRRVAIDLPRALRVGEQDEVHELNQEGADLGELEPADLAIIDKRRSQDGTAEVMHVVGEVKDRVCIIQDDIVDTAGTLTQSAAALRANGAARVLACAVHGVLSGPALERIAGSELEKLVVTNTIPPKPEFVATKRVEVLSVAPLLGKAIQSIHQETSVSSLFV